MLSIGLLAPEFTDQSGGMQEMARELVPRLSREARCVVFARPDRTIPTSPVPVRQVLRGDMRDVGAVLAAAPQPDVWLALNAGLAAVAPLLPAPMVVYVNGNDLLDPWFGYPSTVAMLLRGVPYTYSLRARLRRRALRRSVAGGIRAARTVVANSHNTARIVRARIGTACPPTGVVEPGVADAYFAPRIDAHAVTGRPLHVLTVARLSAATRRKNVDGVLHAIASLPQEVVSHYTVAGDGTDRERLEGVAASLGIAGRVTFAGSLDRERMLAAYRQADLMVLAARSTPHDVEGFGIVYLEASASGVPVVASREGGSTDAVVEGENGIVIPDSSPQSIADAIRAVHTGRVTIHAGRARAVAERYRWDAVTGRFLRQLYLASGKAEPDAAVAAPA